MYYSVAQLLREPIGSTREYWLDGAARPGDRESYISTHGRASLMRTDKGIWVNAKVEASVWATCSRCLSRSACPVAMVIEEEFFPTVDIKTGQSLHGPERAEGFFTIDNQHVLDLTEAVRQHIITNQPMKPLCKLDCLGLCSVCGGNRNEHSCSCGEGSPDPRWASLRQILQSNS